MTVFGTTSVSAQGWPANYDGVMLQGFYWDSFDDSQWTVLEKQTDELAKYFSLIWIPQSGNCDGQSMGYNPKYYWNQNSTFGTENQLRSMIKTFRDKGLGTIADVVINHRQNLSNWVDFPAETYNGVTYQMTSTDICADDDGGETKAWADKNGYKLSPNKDSGEGWGGMRDLDHASANVQKIIKAYEDFLLNDLGYTGFRYDVGKGFDAKYFALYNNASKPKFSVGEVWDGNQVIKNWIDGTKTDGTKTYSEPQSAAFDFQFRYRVRDAINNNNWSNINSADCLIKSENYRRWAVTFVENHDTEKRSNAEQDPIRKDTIAANAVILALPGTPCVFFKHWQAYKKEIKMMIEARKLAGIHNQSAYSPLSTSSVCTALQVTGTKGNLIVAVGPSSSTFSRNGYKTLMAGYHYKYLVEEGLDTSGWNDIINNIEEESKEPEDEPFEKFQATIYVSTEMPASYTSGSVNYWVWDSANKNCCTNSNWPGDKVTQTKEIGGKTWFYSSYDITAANYYLNLVLSTGTGAPQSVDVNRITGDRYFIISADKSGGKNLVTDVTETYNAIAPVVSDSPTSDATYNLQGVRVSSQYKGIVIRNGKKFLKNNPNN